MKQIESDLSNVNLELQSVFSISNRDYFADLLIPSSSSSSSSSSSAASQSSTIPKTTTELEVFLSLFEKKMNDALKDLSLQRDELSKIKSEIAGNNALLTSSYSQLQLLQDKNKELIIYEKEMKEMIYQLNQIRLNPILSESGFENISSIISIEELLIAAKLTEDEARELFVIAKSGKAFLKRLKKAKQQKPDNCPCCGQMMSSSMIQETYERNIKNLFSFADEQEQGTVEEHDMILKSSIALNEKLTLLYQKLSPLLPQRLEIEKYEKMIKDLSNKKEKSKLAYSSQESIVSSVEFSTLQFQKLFRTISELLNRWKSFENRKNEIMDRKKRSSETYMSYGGNINDSGTHRTIEEIEKQFHSNAELKDTLQLKEKKLTADETNYQKKFFTIKAMLQDKQQALADARLDNNRILELENSLKSLERKLEENEERKKKLSNEKRILSSNLHEMNAKYNKSKSDYVSKENEFLSSAAIITKEKEQLITYLTQYEENIRKLNELNITKIMEKLNENIREIQEKEVMIDQELEPLLSQYQNELSSQERTKKNIINNLELRAKSMELDTLKAVLQEKELQYGGRAFLNEMKALEREYSSVTQERQSALSDRDNTKGQLEILKRQTIELQKKLNLPAYKGIEERHRKKLIELETTNMAVTDLDNYYNALYVLSCLFPSLSLTDTLSLFHFLVVLSFLFVSTLRDRALQDFHTLKIKEINKIIRELWQLIYQGQDIDTIEIQSGSDLSDNDGFIVPTTTTTATSSGSGSRSYNYRVVMKKGDIPLDMRGRCSAGQKVLAAIVIRLALAETFCLNCGILALDEPTTNLDDANKLGLASALAKLIIGRSKQQNFQLVCITHDEVSRRLLFVSALIICDCVVTLFLRISYS
jgi:DNA repair protein RAD50